MIKNDGNQEPILVQIVNQNEATQHRLSYAALILSLCAVCVSLWQLSQSEKNNRLSKLPHLNFSTVYDQEQKQIGIFLENNGIGPAVIKSVVVYLDDKKMKDLDAVSKKTSSKFLASGPASWWLPEPGELFAAEKRMPLFYADKENVGSWPRLERLISERIYMQVEYCSIYEDCWVACTNGKACQNSKASDPMISGDENED